MMKCCRLASYVFVVSSLVTATLLSPSAYGDGTLGVAASCDDCTKPGEVALPCAVSTTATTCPSDRQPQPACTACVCKSVTVPGDPPVYTCVKKNTIIDPS